VVGLDIEPGYVTAVETGGHEMSVSRAASAELPAEVVRDGEVVDPVALATVLRALFAEHKFGTRVRLGLANQGVVMRTVDLPPLTDPKQLASAVRFQAQEHIAMPLDQAVLEFQSLGLVGTPDGPRSRVVLVAARRDMVDRLLTATRAAGLRPAGIDLSAFAMIRALHRAEDGLAEVAYINVGGLTNLAVASGTQCVFTRVIPFGTEQMVEALAERRGLTREHSREWLRHVALVEPLESIEGDPEIVRSAREVLLEGVAAIADEARTTLDFYAAQAGGPSAERAVITGPVIGIPGFADRFGEELRIPVEARSVAETEAGSLNGIEPGQATVAAGLTVTEARA
jgi:type IV pilus assembly protein PilM